MSPKYLFTADPIAKFQPVFDTTLRLMEELLSRQIPCDYCDLTQANAELASSEYLAKIPVHSVQKIDLAAKSFIELGKVRTASVNDYSVIFHRKDPPVDDFYRVHSAHFAQTPAHILQINNPAVTPFHSEHELPIEFPEYSIPTTLCSNYDAFVKAVREQKVEAVAKPLNECSGNGVRFFLSDCDENLLQEYWDAWKPAVIVQPFLDEITKSGDLRILVFNKKILGSVLRVPKKGSRLANLHQGAIGKAATPTPRQLEAVRHVAEALNPKGLYLLGLDFIGDYLSEVNITSPSALQQINDVMHTRIQVPFIDECEALSKTLARLR